MTDAGDLGAVPDTQPNNPRIGGARVAARRGRFH